MRIPPPAPAPEPTYPIARVANYSPHPYRGWMRVQGDGPVPLDGGDGWVFAGARGADAWAADVWVDEELQPGEVRDIKLAPGKRIPKPLSPDVTLFGGLLTLDGAPMEIVRSGVEGVALVAHCRARAGRMWVVDVWLRHYVGSGYAEAEVMVTASNPAVPDVEAVAEPGQLELSFGDGILIVDGRIRPPLLAPGTKMADGQAIACPALWVWPRLMGTFDWHSLFALADLTVSGHAIQRPYPQGTPLLPAGFDTINWAVDHYRKARAVLQNLGHPGIGPNARSADTGAQEDQTFVRGEPMLLPGAEIVAYLGALAMAKRPCQHREADGSLLALHVDAQPRGVMWDSRWHFSTGVSPYQGGKSRPLSDGDIPGRWWGADVEHWLLFNLATAARYTDSPALDAILETQARIYPHQWTLSPELSTSQPYAARAVGWECAAAVMMHRQLRNRGVAELVAQHWRARMDKVTLPVFDQHVRDWHVDIWDVRVDDNRLGPGNWWLPYQQAIGAYWLDVAGEWFGHSHARTRALGAAMKVMECWRQDDAGRWVCVPVCAAGTETTAPADGSFAYYGMALAPAVVLRHDPQDVKAQAIIDYLATHATLPEHTRWLAPEVVTEPMQAMRTMVEAIGPATAAPCCVHYTGELDEHGFPVRVVQEDAA